MIKRILVNEHFGPAVCDIISHAKKEILMCYFKIQSSPRPDGRKIMAIYSALVRAKNRGVEIKVLTNLHTGSSLAAYINTRTARQLRKYGITVRGFNRPKVAHTKLCLVDSEVYIIGSHNITKQAIGRNYELSLLIKDAATAASIKSSFLSFWSLSKD